jgi:hypothetical protein
VSDPEVELGVELASMCRAFSCLPGSGGLLDQDWYLLELTKCGLIVLEEKDQIDQKKEAESLRVKSQQGR